MKKYSFNPDLTTSMIHIKKLIIRQVTNDESIWTALAVFAVLPNDSFCEILDRIDEEVSTCKDKEDTTHAVMNAVDSCFYHLLPIPFVKPEHLRVLFAVMCNNKVENAEYEDVYLGTQHKVTLEDIPNVLYDRIANNDMINFFSKKYPLTRWSDATNCPNIQFHKTS